MTTRWKDFDTSTDEDRARVTKERAPIAWAVVDKIGTVVHLAYTEGDALAWFVDATSEFKNRNMNSPGYRTVVLVAK